MTRSEAVRIDDSFSYRGIDAVFLENARVRLLVLPGKGGDVLEFRDKRTDVNVLWQADHDWRVPRDGEIPVLDPNAVHDFYPGGWQLHLPLAGYTDDFDGTPYSLHGESALISWDATIARNDEEAVTLRLETDLVRYPFHIERELTLRADRSTLGVTERITNESDVELPFIWQQHVALGAPLIGPDATLDIPADSGLTDDYGPEHRNNRLASDESFEWPLAPGRDGGVVDLREFPPYDSTIDDLAYATDLREGFYCVVNDTIDLGFAFEFPTDPFESVWYWQPFGGASYYPFWNRNYNIGIEPTTAYPASRVPEAQRENGSLKTLGPRETQSASFAATVDSASAFEG
jgi:hypothetical protein